MAHHLTLGCSPMAPKGQTSPLNFNSGNHALFIIVASTQLVVVLLINFAYVHGVQHYNVPGQHKIPSASPKHNTTINGGVFFQLHTMINYNTYTSYMFNENGVKTRVLHLPKQVFSFERYPQQGALEALSCHDLLMLLFQELVQLISFWEVHPLHVILQVDTFFTS